jgi:thiol-disulfide isomerase/thioredoxin
MENNFDWRKYVLVLLITTGLFLTAVYISNYFGNKKIEQLQTIQDKISIDILSSETQYSLLSELSCKNISDSVLSTELYDLGGKLEWSRKNLGQTEEVSNLNKYYSLLEIKDYLLNKKIAASCKIKSPVVLYFYTDKENCTLCDEEMNALSTLQGKYPSLRVYSFDYGIDLSAVKAMIKIYKIKDTELPALIVGDDLVTGFHNFDDLEKIVNKSFKLKEKPQ